MTIDYPDISQEE